MVEAREQVKSVFKLRKYQREFFALTVRIAVALWCRQAGKDFTTGGYAVNDAFRTRSPWYIISLTQRQADATFDKCKTFFKALKEASRFAGDCREIESEEYDDYDSKIDHVFKSRARTLILPGGGSVTSLPGRDPDTLAGLTGNVIFTEFGLFPNGGRDHWRVIWPLITSGLYRIRAISTPRGRDSMLFDLVNDPTYTTFKVDIFRAVADGLKLYGQNGQPCTIEEFKKLYRDEIGWKREYLLEFTGDMEALVTWGKLTAAADDKPCEIIRINGYHQPGQIAAIVKRILADGGRLELGWDVARRGDISSLWGNLYRPGNPRRLALLVIMKNTDFATQQAVVCEIMDASFANVGAGDATGLGMQANEYLENRYGQNRWKPYTFTAVNKANLGSRIRMAFDDGDQRIPIADGETKFIANDIYCVECDTSGQRLRLSENENALEPDSHCDIAYSCGLSREGGTLEAAEPGVIVL